MEIGRAERPAPPFFVLKAFEHSDIIALYFVDFVNWMARTMVKLVVGRDVDVNKHWKSFGSFFGGKKKSDDESRASRNVHANRINRMDVDVGPTMQDLYVVPYLGRKINYEDMKTAERFVLETVDVIRHWRDIYDEYGE